MQKRAATIPLRRIGTPLDNARWVRRLALIDDWVNGAALPVDGDMSAG